MHVPTGHCFPDATGVTFTLVAWAHHHCLQLYSILYRVLLQSVSIHTVSNLVTMRNLMSGQFLHNAKMIPFREQPFSSIAGIIGHNFVPLIPLKGTYWFLKVVILNLMVLL